MFHYVKVGLGKYAPDENCGSDQVYSQIDKTRIYYSISIFTHIILYLLSKLRSCSRNCCVKIYYILTELD